MSKVRLTHTNNCLLALKLKRGNVAAITVMHGFITFHILCILCTESFMNFESVSM